MTAAVVSNVFVGGKWENYKRSFIWFVCAVGIYQYLKYGRGITLVTQFYIPFYFRALNLVF